MMLEREREGSWREAAASKSEKSKIASLSLSLTRVHRMHSQTPRMHDDEREREEGGREREADKSRIRRSDPAAPLLSLAPHQERRQRPFRPTSARANS